MLSAFEASLSFELEPSIEDMRQFEPKIKVHTWDDEEGELGDSCCFGTRTVETVDFGLDCVLRLYGGV